MGGLAAWEASQYLSLGYVQDASGWNTCDIYANTYGTMTCAPDYTQSCTDCCEAECPDHRCKGCTDEQIYHPPWHERGEFVRIIPKIRAAVIAKFTSDLIKIIKFILRQSGIPGAENTFDMLLKLTGWG
jgi:hypothetical protein